MLKNDFDIICCHKYSCSGTSTSAYFFAMEHIIKVNLEIKCAMRLISYTGIKLMLETHVDLRLVVRN